MSVRAFIWDGPAQDLQGLGRAYPATGKEVHTALDVRYDYIERSGSRSTITTVGGRKLGFSFRQPLEHKEVAVAISPCRLCITIVYFGSDIQCLVYAHRGAPPGMTRCVLSQMAKKSGSKYHAAPFVCVDDEVRRRKRFCYYKQQRQQLIGHKRHAEDHVIYESTTSNFPTLKVSLELNGDVQVEAGGQKLSVKALKRIALHDKGQQAGENAIHRPKIHANHAFTMKAGNSLAFSNSTEQQQQSSFVRGRKVQSTLKKACYPIFDRQIAHRLVETARKAEVAAKIAEEEASMKENCESDVESDGGEDWIKQSWIDKEWIE